MAKSARSIVWKVVMVKIALVEDGSVAYRYGIRGGDLLLTINHNEINDVLDYRFYLTERIISLMLSREGEEYSVTIRKGEYDDIGLVFETPLMDKKHSCTNACVFCFIDQNPEGMRESIYFKDDDSRLSFLHGNYITLTNMTEKDILRIIKMRFSPINISVHTTNPELRVKMMKNRFAGDVLRYLDMLKDAGIRMCMQVVLCRSLNDGEELVRTMHDLSRYLPALCSCAIVPAGLTKHRDGLYPLSDFSSAEASMVIDTVNAYGEEMLRTHGSRVFFVADEFYLKAGRPLPESDYYEDYSQIDNGVGMLTSFEEEFEMAFLDADLIEKHIQTPYEVSIATGVASYGMISRLATRLEERFPDVRIHTYCVKNEFFGESVTVSGLLTGIDLLNALKDKPLGSALYLSSNTQKADEDVFLCGMTKNALSEALATPIVTVPSDGYEFLYRILGLDPDMPL